MNPQTTRPATNAEKATFVKLNAQKALAELLAQGADVAEAIAALRAAKRMTAANALKREWEKAKDLGLLTEPVVETVAEAPVAETVAETVVESVEEEILVEDLSDLTLKERILRVVENIRAAHLINEMTETGPVVGAARVATVATVNAVQQVVQAVTTTAKKVHRKVRDFFAEHKWVRRAVKAVAVVAAAYTAFLAGAFAGGAALAQRASGKFLGRQALAYAIS